MDPIFQWLIAQALRRPVLLRTGLEVLRRRRPIWKMGNTLVVLGNAGVREVLLRPRDFLNGMVYAPKLKLGPLVLGMDDSCRYRAERKVSEDVLAAAGTLKNFGSLVTEEAETQLNAAINVGPVDFVSRVCEPILVGAICKLFEIDPAGAESKLLVGSKGIGTLIQWLRKLGGAIGAGNPAPFGLEPVAEAAAVEFESYLQGQIEASDGQLIRQLKEQLGKAHVVRCLGGTLMATAALFKAATLALHQLLVHDKGKEILAGFASAKPPAPVIDYVWEALRFDPPFPFLARHCPRQTTLAGVLVPANGSVVISPLAAMFDPCAVDNPDEFSPSRPRDVYYVFGAGLHLCVGLPLAHRGLEALFEAMFRRLSQEQMRMAGRGQVRYDGPAVAEYVIELEKCSSPIEAFPDAASSIDDRSSIPSKDESCAA